MNEDAIAGSDRLDQVDRYPLMRRPILVDADRAVLGQ
jgi:hypothetical protein